MLKSINARNILAGICILVLLGTSFQSAPSSASSTSVLNQSATFNSGAVDIWSAFGGQADWTLLNQPFDTGALSDKTTVSIPGAGGVTTNFNFSGCGDDLLDCFTSPGDYFSVSVTSADIGAGAKFQAKGKIAFFGSADNLSGSAAVSYPVSANLEYPTPESFMPGNTITVGGNWTTGAGAAINAGETRGDIQLDGDFGLGSSAEACGYGPSEDCGALFPSFDWSSGKTTLFSVGVLDPVPTIPTGLVGIGGDMGYLSVTPSTTTVGPGGSVSVQGKNKFSDVVFDLDKLAQSIIVPGSAKLPTLENSVDLTSTGIPLSAGYNVFDADAHVVLNANQTLTFKNPNVRMKYFFSEPMAGFSGPYLDKAPDNSWVEFKLGDEISVEFPESQTQPVTVTPTAYLNGTLHNKTRLETDGFIELQAGSFNLTVPGFEVFPKVGGGPSGLQYPEPKFEVHMHDSEICDFTGIFGGCETICTACIPHLHDAGVTMKDINIPSFGPWTFPGLGPFNIGPLWGPEQHANSTTTDSLADGDMPVNSFAPITLNSFVLNPQNIPVAEAGGPYMVDEGSTVMLDGSGSSDADGEALTYHWDLDNDGDFDASGAAVPYYGEDGPSNPDVRLKVCDTNSNCDEDMTSVTVNNVAPTAAFNVPVIIGQNNPLVLSLTSPSDPSVPDMDAGFTYAFDCKDGNGYSVFNPNNQITCSATQDGNHIVKGKIKDKDGGVTEYSGVVLLDRTPPEAYNQFDPATKDVFVFGRDGGSGLPSGPISPSSVVMVPWDDDDDGDEAELRTYNIVDVAGNTLVLVEKARKNGKEIRVEVVSLKYNDKPVIKPSFNIKKFEWSTEKNGVLKELKQKLTVGKSIFKKETEAKYESKKNVTTIDSRWSRAVKMTGLILLRLATDEGDLEIEY